MIVVKYGVNGLRRAPKHICRIRESFLKVLLPSAAPRQGRFYCEDEIEDIALSHAAFMGLGCWANRECARSIGEQGDRGLGRARIRLRRHRRFLFLVGRSAMIVLAMTKVAACAVASTRATSWPSNSPQGNWEEELETTEV